MKLEKLLSIVFILFLSACGGSSDEDTDDQLDLDGTWVSNCRLVGENNSSLHKVIYLNNTLETVTSTFDNRNCSEEPIDVLETIGTFSIGNTIQTSSGLDAVEVTYEFLREDEIFVLLDIIRQEDNTINIGIQDNTDTFPTELDFDIPLIRQ